MNNFLRKIFFSLRMKNRLMVFVAIYALLIAVSLYFLPGLFGAILCLFLIVFSAVFWGLAGGLISAVWSGSLMAVSTFYLQLSTLRGFLFGSFAYFIIASGVGMLSDAIKKKQVELLSACDSTIEGWSKALDLRDKETEGHSLRVTDMTVKLARIMGLGESELIHIRRGALLHDIGKMGIRDNILLKPGPLTDSEWEIMRKHPQFAFDLLSPTAYLREALDIPHYHHEKWDGTGYPRGLKGEQIPLAARIFSVADVWDALSSDRPYRPAWSYEKICEYLIEQKEKSFDPAIVDMFLKNVVKCSIP
jgi:putative nucleotidyltransferase with HDIG domain